MRLTSPAGTVVECNGTVAEKLIRQGWSEDKPKEEPKPRAKRAAAKK